jgi:hypothetical protein
VVPQIPQRHMNYLPDMGFAIATMSLHHGG